MEAFIEFEIEPTEVNCLVEGSEGAVRSRLWEEMPEAIKTNLFEMQLSHERSLNNLYVLSSQIYEGCINLTILKPGLVLVDGKAKATVHIEPKYLKEIIDDHPENTTLIAIRSVPSEETNGMLYPTEDIPIKFNISADRI